MARIREVWLLSILCAATVLPAFAADATGAPPAAAAPPRVRYGAPARGALAAGALLVLSAGSLAYDGSHPGNASIASAGACADACAALPGCNAWTFCGDGVAGCGSGCKGYTDLHPKMPMQGPQSPEVTAQLPITAFGPWTWPHSSEDGCQPIGDTGGSSSDAWPFGMCTLKSVNASGDGGEALIKSPPLREGSQGEGWVSGAIALPDACAGVSAATCAACLSTPNAAACLSCARDTRAQPATAAAFVAKRALGGLDAVRACVACSNITAKAEREMCYDCSLSGKPCAICALGSVMWGTGPPDAASCLSCVAKRGQALAGECNECAQSRAPKRCFACLESFNLKLCKTGDEPVGSCRPRGDQTPCARCANGARSDEAFGSCLSCFSNTQRDGECAGCADLPGSAADQARCYGCVSKAGFKSFNTFGCAQCYSAWVAPDRREACLKCAESKSTPPAAKRHCATCSDGGPRRGDAKGRASCIACLQSPRTKRYDTQCLGQRDWGDFGSRRRLLRLEERPRADAGGGAAALGGGSWFARRF
ncbi:hypothetical protein Rsub_00956 [Raphidocelis subcapitata]|uniref:Apple domain-containing protein n=1 Tax=Raphidocelis subcapitata TaxID=307507 RepID=A0A2V0NLF4_9CHLO|nr:hypothetical protein Rsub_00956 [Raphidocelis subcapitata]|eukprot:GBF88244.1 hypothetical protein Rsub_00956 [Raphidocelis subcapitata]